jgi:preprotein translocase subunit SecA
MLMLSSQTKQNSEPHSTQGVNEDELQSITDEQRSDFISKATDEQFLELFDQWHKLNQLDEIANLIEHTKFPIHLLSKIILKDPADCLSLMNKALDSEKLDIFQRIANKCDTKLLSEFLFYNFTYLGRGSIFECLMRLACNEEVPLEIKEKIELTVSDFLDSVNSESIDKFIIQDNAKKYSNLIAIMEYGSSKNFIKLIKKANPIALRVALSKSIKENKKLFSLSVETFLTQESYDALIKERDADTIKSVLDKLEPHVLYRFEKKKTANDKDTVPSVIHDNQDARTASELLDLIGKNNAGIVGIQELGDQLENLEERYTKTASLNISSKPICEWNKEDCQQWANQIKQSNKVIDTDFQAEMIAVCMQAIKIHSGYSPRDTQLLSLLLFLQAKDKGRLAQIATGEGKSLTVAMLAIIQVFKGKKVDIVTSSPILAVRDSDEKKSLYDFFNISVADNWDKKDGNRYRSGPKVCYKADIVYGDACSFQWDLLRDEYMREGTRNGRPFEFVIGDEVDSMLLDEFSRGGRLTASKTSMESLTLLLAAIWQQLSRVEYELNRESKDIDDHLTFIKSSLKEHAIKLINDQDSKVNIPNHLKEFALYQVDNWVASAMNVRYKYRIRENYILTEIEDGRSVISPVDYTNTGVVQSNTVWDNGIHQFLQIKHGIELQPENLFNCFISNLGFFNRYDKNIYGLTGTLGSEATQNLLKSIYPVDLVFIPTFRDSSFKEIPGILVNSPKYWLKEIIESAKAETDKKRAVLIICESINAVDQIESELNKVIDRNTISIERYSRSDNNENLAVAEVVKPGKIIIATNLAGRGTDIKTSPKVEKQGGLHVCLTFFPENQRVEDQALGRTARQGNEGTGQLIIDKSKTIFQQATTITEMKELRKKRELSQLQYINDFEIEKIKLEDVLFSEFSDLVKELRKINDSENAISEVEDRWGFWLKKWSDKMMNNREVYRDEIIKDYLTFKQSILQEYNQLNYKNPYLLISNGNNAHSLEDAIQDHTNAISLGENTSAQAYYNRAFKKLQLGDRQGAVDDLEMAKKIIREHLIPNCQAFHLVLNASPYQVNHNSSQLFKQKQTKVDIYQKQIQHIDQAIAMIRNADPSSTLVVNNSGQLYQIYDELHASPEQMRELYQSGLNDFYNIEEIPEEDDDDDIFGVFAVITLGIMQIAMGVALSVAAPGVGTFIGSALISEGIGDILFAVRGAMEGNFSFDNYLAGKGTSIAISIVAAGIDIIKLKLAEQAGKTAAKEFTKELTKEELKRIATEKVVQAVVSAGIKETVNLAVNCLSRDTLNQFKSDIRDKIRGTLLNHLNQEEVRTSIDKLLAADQANHNNKHIIELKQLANAIICSNQRSKSTAENIFSGVLARQSAMLGKIIQLADVGNALEDICQLTKSFAEDFSYSAKLLSSNLSITNNNQSEARENFYNYLVDTITTNIMSMLHGRVVRPVTGSVVNDVYDDLSQKMSIASQRAQLSEIIQQHNQELSATGKIGFFENEIKRENEHESSKIQIVPKPSIRHSTAKQKKSEPTPANIKRANDFYLDQLTINTDSDLPSNLQLFELTKNINWNKDQKNSSTNTANSNSLNKIEVTKDTLLGVCRGAGMAIKDLWNGLIYPTISLTYDASIIAAEKAMTFSPGGIVDPMAQDFLAFDNSIHPSQRFVEAGARMHKRGETLSLLGSSFMEGNIPPMKFIYDSSLLSANKIKFYLGGIADPLVQDVITWQDVIRHTPGQVENANQRMQDRSIILGRLSDAFEHATIPKRAEMISRVVTDLLLPGYILKGGQFIVRGVKNYKNFGVIWEPPLFHDIQRNAINLPGNLAFTADDVIFEMVSAVTQPTLIKPSFIMSPSKEFIGQAKPGLWMPVTREERKLILPNQIDSRSTNIISPQPSHEKMAKAITLTMDDLKMKQEGFSFIYVITEDKKLIMAPAYWNDIKLHHTHLSKGKPVYGAGEGYVAGKIKINNASGHHLPSGNIQRKVAIHTFKKNGLLDAGEAYSEVTRLSMRLRIPNTPYQPIVSYKNAIGWTPLLSPSLLSLSYLSHSISQYGNSIWELASSDSMKSRKSEFLHNNSSIIRNGDANKPTWVLLPPNVSEASLVEKVMSFIPRGIADFIGIDSVSDKKPTFPVNQIVEDSLINLNQKMISSDDCRDSVAITMISPLSYPKVIMLVGPLGENLMILPPNFIQLPGAKQSESIPKNQICTIKEAFQKNISPNVTLIGNGKRDLTLQDIQYLLKETASSKGNILLYVLGHGNTNQDNHHLFHLGDERDIKSESLFSSIANNLSGKPIDVIFETCYAGAVNKNIKKILPTGSTFMSLTAASEPMNQYYSRRLFEKLSHQDMSYNKFTPENLLLSYLTSTMGLNPGWIDRFQTYQHPIIDSPTSKIIKPAPELYFGKNFSEKEKKNIHKKLAPFVSREKLKSVIKSIESAGRDIVSSADYNGVWGPAISRETVPYRDYGIMYSIILIANGEFGEEPSKNYIKTKTIPTLSQTTSVQLRKFGLFENQTVQSTEYTSSSLGKTLFWRLPDEPKQQNKLEHASTKPSF